MSADVLQTWQHKSLQSRKERASSLSRAHQYTDLVRIRRRLGRLPGRACAVLAIQRRLMRVVFFLHTARRRHLCQSGPQRVSGELPRRPPRCPHATAARCR